MSEEKKEFVCIECSSKISSIFKVYQDGFQDIIQCVKTSYHPNPNFGRLFIDDGFLLDAMRPLGGRLCWMRELGDFDRFDFV